MAAPRGRRDYITVVVFSLLSICAAVPSRRRTQSATKSGHETPIDKFDHEIAKAFAVLDGPQPNISAACSQHFWNHWDDMNCDIQDVANTSTFAAAIIALSLAVLCAVPAFCHMCCIHRPPCGCIYPLNFLMFLYDIFAFVMCWSVYNSVSAVQGVHNWVVDATLGLSVAPTIVAFFGLILGCYWIGRNEEPTSGFSGVLLLMSPWKSVLFMYYKHDREDLDEIDLYVLLVAHAKYLLLDIPLGAICVYVMVEHGWNVACTVKAALEFLRIVSFWVLRFICPPPWGPCGCCSSPGGCCGRSCDSSYSSFEMNSAHQYGAL